MWRAESKIDQIGLFGKILAKNETYYLLSNPIKGEFKKGHIDQQPSLAICACFAFPSFSMFWTTWSAAYFASSLFCFVSSFSPSLQNGLGKIFWNGAAWSRSITSSCDNACSMRRQKRTALPSSLKLWKSSVLASGYCTMSWSVAW